MRTWTSEQLFDIVLPVVMRKVSQLDLDPDTLQIVSDLISAPPLFVDPLNGRMQKELEALNVRSLMVLLNKADSNQVALQSLSELLWAKVRLLTEDQD